MSFHIRTGTGAPTTIPTELGQHYIDTLNQLDYISVGTSSAADWKESVTIINSVFGRVGVITAQTGDYTPTQVGLGNVQNLDQTNPSNITQDATHRFTNDTDITRLTLTSGTNTGDVAVATSTEINTGTDNIKTVSALGLASSAFMRPLITSITTTGGTTTLTAAQNKSTSFEVNGVLTSDATIIVADIMAPFTVENLTTGSFKLIFKTAAGGSATVEQFVKDGIKLLYADGIDCEQVSTTLTMGKVQALANGLNSF